MTGGARGLGLVMAQGMVSSGANVALVDMNSKFKPEPNRLAHTDADDDRRGGGREADQAPHRSFQEGKPQR